MEGGPGAVYQEITVIAFSPVVHPYPCDGGAVCQFYCYCLSSLSSKLPPLLPSPPRHPCRLLNWQERRRRRREERLFAFPTFVNPVERRDYTRYQRQTPQAPFTAPAPAPAPIPPPTPAAAPAAASPQSVYPNTAPPAGHVAAQAQVRTNYSRIQNLV